MEGIAFFQKNTLLYALFANVVCAIVCVLWGDPWFTLSVAAFVICGGVLGLWWALNKILAWESAQGKVVGHVEIAHPFQTGQQTKVCLVQFAWQGKEYEGQDERGRQPPFPVGKEVVWLFQKETPERGEIRQWWAALYFVGLTAAGCYVLWYELMKGIR